MNFHLSNNVIIINDDNILTTTTTAITTTSTNNNLPMAKAKAATTTTTTSTTNTSTTNTTTISSFQQQQPDQQQQQQQSDQQQQQQSDQQIFNNNSNNYTTTTTTNTIIIRYDYDNWPKLTSIIDFYNNKNKNIIGNPQFLLDFAIVGHGKCGTTSIANWLSSSLSGNGSESTSVEHEQQHEQKEIIMPNDEVLDLILGTPSSLIHRLYTQLKKPPKPKPKTNNNNNNNTITTMTNSTTTTTTTMSDTVTAIRTNNNDTNIIIQKNISYIRGYKSPGDIRSPYAIQALNNYFPNTLLIVGIRHPVLWFESLYNFKLQNLHPTLPSNYWGNPNLLVGKCSSFTDFFCVGTSKGYFHVHLAQLGKTILTNITTINTTNTTTMNDDVVDDNVVLLDPATIQLQTKYPMLLKGNITKTITNPIFLFDIEQISSKPYAYEYAYNDAYDDAYEYDALTTNNSSNSSFSSSSQLQQQLQLQLLEQQHEQRLDIFHNDMEYLLGVSKNTLSKRLPKSKPGKKLKNHKLQKLRDQYKINICNPKYKIIHNELMKLSIEISNWLIDSKFVYHSDVTISSRNYFINIILKQHYKTDPCKIRRNRRLQREVTASVGRDGKNGNDGVGKVM